MKMHMIGNAHIDPVWLWQWREGYHEVKATFRSALDRMNENGDFVFTCACACYYQWIEESDPDMFEEIRARVRDGRWCIVGGMWIQPDMNAPSGESFARQLLYSQRYFREKFGTTAEVGYNVDSFGHNAMMPQIFRKAGIHSYVWMRPSVVENPDIPEGAMLWEAPDGSRIQAYRIFGEYTCFHNIPEKVGKLFAFSERIGQPVMCFYGVGNHGGGPTIENLRQINAIRSETPDVVYSSPEIYFRDLENLPIWKSELQHHASGCYSTHSLSKKKHRAAESALTRMERLNVLSGVLTGHRPKSEFVRQAWENLMFNEFHDIMGGCSLPEAMDEAVLQLDEAISIAAREENRALQKISWQVDTSKGLPVVRSKEEDWKLWGIRGQGTPVVVFNPHAFEVEDAITIHRPIRAVTDDQGSPVPAQVIRASRTNGKDDRWDGMFLAKVPALGYRLYWMYLEGEELPSTLSASASHLENECIRAEFNPETGALTRLIDKRTGRDALSAPARTKLMDIEHCDTWAHMVFKFDKPAGEFAPESIEVLECGPARAVVRTVARFGRSVLEQKYILCAGSDQIEVEARLDMHEKHRMVKLCFPAAGCDVSEIPYGSIVRTANGNEQHCQRWVAMQAKDGGLAVLNTGKYSYSATDGELRMTIANTSVFADHYGQEYRDASCLYMDMGEQTFRYALVPYSGSRKDAHLNRRASVLNQPLVGVVETYHTGPLKGEFCGVSVDNPAVDMGAIKRAEDGKGHVLRFVETAGEEQSAMVDLKLLDRSFPLSLSPFEIKTLYLPDDPNLPEREIPITEIE